MVAWNVRMPAPVNELPPFITLLVKDNGKVKYVVKRYNEFTGEYVPEEDEE